MEQGRKAKELVQAEECMVAGLVAAVEAEVSVQGLVEIVSAPVVVHKQFINWGLPAMSRSVQNAVRP
jgi:hypothetical protein